MYGYGRQISELDESTELGIGRILSSVSTSLSILDGDEDEAVRGAVGEMEMVIWQWEDLN